MRSEVEESKPNIWIRIAAGLLLFALGVLFIVGQSYVVQYSGYDALAERTQVLIDDGMRENERTFLIFSAVKASLALIEGSTVGIGVEVQVGDLIQPAYDFVDFFWKMFLVAFVVMGFYKILMDAGILTLGFPLIGIGLLILAGSMVLPTKRWNARGLARRLIMLGLLMTYALPLSLLASDYLSQTYVAELKMQHQATIDNFQTELMATRGDFLALKQEISILNPGRSLGKVENGLVALAKSIGASFHESFLSFLYYVLIVFFELLILPFCTAFMLYLIVRRLMDGLVVPKVPVVQIAPVVEATSIN